jgi:hypothetical protein
MVSEGLRKQLVELKEEQRAYQEAQAKRSEDLEKHSKETVRISQGYDGIHDGHDETTTTSETLDCTP